MLSWWLPRCSLLEESLYSSGSWHRQRKWVSGRAVLFQSLHGKQSCSFPCSTTHSDSIYPQGSYQMVLHLSAFNGANALLAKITLNATLHHVNRVWIFFKSKIKWPDSSISIRICLNISFSSPETSVFVKETAGKLIAGYCRRKLWQALTVQREGKVVLVCRTPTDR